MKYLLIILVTLSSFAFDTSSEIKALNEEFNEHKNYPILIFNKDLIKEKIDGKTTSQKLLIIKNHVSDLYQVEITLQDADIILSYHTTFDSSASALPFYSNGFDSYKFCAVFPSGNKGDHLSEIKRGLGISKESNPYEGLDLDTLKNLLTLKELKLISLYHELAHCLDRKYAPRFEAQDGHSIHENESFAEVLSLLMLAKRKKMRKIGFKRGILRGIYAKYMGKFLATDPSVVEITPAIRDGGLIYYLTPVILKAQERISSYSFRMQTGNTETLLKMAEVIVEEHSLTSREFSAIRVYLKDGKEAALTMYRNYTIDSPDLFLGSYLKLRETINFFEILDDMILNTSF